MMVITENKGESMNHSLNVRISKKQAEFLSQFEKKSEVMRLALDRYIKEVESNVNEPKRKDTI